MLTFKQLLQKELKHGNQDYLDENRRSLGRFANKAKYYFPSSDTFENVGLFYPDKLGQYYTTLHNNKSFTFTTDRSKISDKLRTVFNYTDDDVADYTK